MYLKILEAEDVEDTDGLEVVLPSDLLVDPCDDPGERLGVQRHGNRVPRAHRLSVKSNRVNKIIYRPIRGVGMCSKWS